MQQAEQLMDTDSSTRSGAYQCVVACFLVLIFISLIGLQIPFQGVAETIEDKPGPNLINKIVHLILLAICSVCLAVRRRELWAFVKSEKYMTLLLIWCALSPLWSSFPFESVKRTSQLIIGALVCLTMVVYSRKSEDTLRYFTWVLYPYMILTFIAIAVIPGAYDPQTTAWRGLATSKNHLGQVCIINIIIWWFTFRAATGRQRIAPGVMLFLSLTLLAGSHSMTSTMALTGLVILGVIMQLTRSIMPLQLARIYTTLLVFAAVALMVGATTTQHDILSAVTKGMGKDPTFTGRTDLWLSVWHEAKQHLLMGCGIGGFWSVTNPVVLGIYEDFVWLPNQAHLGYLDMLNETGIIGMSLLFIVLVSYFTKAYQWRQSNIWHWFILAILLINIQESTLFRPTFPTCIMFIYSYMAFSGDYTRRRQSDPDCKELRYAKSGGL